MSKIIFILFSFSWLTSQSQDSISKLKLRVFDLNLAGTSTCKESAKVNMDYVKSFTNNNSYFLNEPYTAGFSDTARYRNYIRGRKRNRYQGAPENAGSVYSMVGINLSFKFVDEKHRFIERIKPRIGIYHSKRRFFAHNIGSNERYPGDTLFFSDPKYPPIIIQDSGIFRNINYQYVSKQIYGEIGCNLDIYRTRFFVFYSGFLFGFGRSYNNELIVRKDEYYYYTYKPYSTTQNTN